MLLFVPRDQADYISKLNLVEKIQDVVVGWLLWQPSIKYYKRQAEGSLFSSRKWREYGFAKRDPFCLWHVIQYGWESLTLGPTGLAKPHFLSRTKVNIHRCRETRGFPGGETGTQKNPDPPILGCPSTSVKHSLRKGTLTCFVKLYLGAVWG